jgi:hypothetical protein
VKLKLVVLVLGFVILSESCKDIIFNNPLDPDASLETPQIVKIIPTSLSGAGDIAYDGEKCWKINEFGSLNAFDIESGVTIRTISTVPGTGLATLLDKMYICGESNIISTYDPLSGDLIDRISTGDLYPKFLSPMEDRLLMYDIRSLGFYEYQPETGMSTPLFQLSGVDIGGIEYYQGGVLFTDIIANSIYHYTLDGEMVNVYLSPAAATTGITVDGSGYLYLFTLDGQINKVSLP